jgi:hypothetical protein
MQHGPTIFRIGQTKSAMSQKFPLLFLNVLMVSNEFFKLFVAVYYSSIHLVLVYFKKLEDLFLF